MSIDSWRASSMKAQVLTTDEVGVGRVVGRGEAVGPSIPTSLSESTWFLGQPRVSTQNRDPMTQQATGAP